MMFCVSFFGLYPTGVSRGAGQVVQKLIKLLTVVLLLNIISIICYRSNIWLFWFLPRLTVGN